MQIQGGSRCASDRASLGKSSQVQMSAASKSHNTIFQRTGTTTRYAADAWHMCIRGGARGDAPCTRGKCEATPELVMASRYNGGLDAGISTCSMVIAPCCEPLVPRCVDSARQRCCYLPYQCYTNQRLRRGKHMCIALYHMGPCSVLHYTI